MMKRLDQLTFTRFAMVLLVLFYHGTGEYYTAFLANTPLAPLLRSAPTAVAYLYVLSGFVMSLVYYRPEQKFDIAGYWRARFVRIYPLYIISFLLVCVYYSDSLFRIKPQKILANIFVVQAWFPAYSQSFNYAAWSMTVEFFFYAVFPFLILWMARQSTRKLIGLALAFWAFSQAVSYILWAGYYPEYKDFIVYFPVFHLNSFVIGVVGGIWYLREGRAQVIPSRSVLFVAAISFLLIAAYTIISTRVFPVLPHDLQPMSGLLSPIMVLLILALALDGSRLSRFLQYPALVNLGESSYAIYILHVPVYWLYERWLETSGVVADPTRFFDLTFLPLMILLGLASHFFLDIPLRRWLKDFLQTISIRLLLLDIAIITFTVFFVFQFRFDGREYRAYRDMERFMFWVAFFARPIFSILLGAYRPAIIMKQGADWIRAVLFSATAGTLVIMGSVYWGYATGWFENFPRSIFVFDWLIFLMLSLLVRFGFRILKKYKSEPLPA
jgi:peptidoglycan/LPS O-acetylase OafA/YrhL